MSGARVRLTEESEHHLLVLRRGLRRASWFTLFVVLASDFPRAEVLRRLISWSGRDGVPALRLLSSGPEVVGELEAFLVAADKANPLPGLIVPFGEVLLEEAGGQGLRSLNMGRDVLGKLISGPLVLVLPEARAAELAASAEDLWDVRAGTFVIEGVAEEVGAKAAWGALSHPGVYATPAAIADAEREASRLAEVEASGNVDAGALADAWLRIADMYFRANQPAKSLQAAERAEAMARHIGYFHIVAGALLKQSNVFEQLGSVSDWVRVSRAALVHYTAMGLPPGIALGQMNLGRALLRAGELDEALQILRAALDLSAHYPDFAADAPLMISSWIAEVHRFQSHIDESIRILRRILSAIVERRDKTDVLWRAFAVLAESILLRDAPGDRGDAAALLQLAHAEALLQGEAETIRDIQRELDLPIDDKEGGGK